MVRLAGKHLRERFEKEKKLADPKTGRLATVAKLDGHGTQPDSAERISAFLGDKNWSRRKVTVAYTFSLLLLVVPQLFLFRLSFAPDRSSN